MNIIVINIFIEVAFSSNHMMILSSAYHHLFLPISFDLQSFETFFEIKFPNHYHFDLYNLIHLSKA